MVRERGWCICNYSVYGKRRQYDCRLFFFCLERLDILLMSLFDATLIYLSLVYKSFCHFFELGLRILSEDFCPPRVCWASPWTSEFEVKAVAYLQIKTRPGTLQSDYTG